MLCIQMLLSLSLPNSSLFLQHCASGVVQFINLQTSPGKIEHAIMHVIHLDAIVIKEKRLTAMLQRNPLHTFMFDRAGKLVIANNAAMEACRHSSAGITASQT